MSEPTPVNPGPVIGGAHKSTLPVVEDPYRDMKLTRTEVEKLLADRPPVSGWRRQRFNLRGADLSGENLSELDLSNVDFSEANLEGVDLYLADLSYSRLLYANLRRARLSSAKLHQTWIEYADLTGAALNPTDAAVLGYTSLALPRGLPSGAALLIPTPSRWELSVGCWTGSPAGLRELIAQDEGWPEARGGRVLERRPLLEAFLTIVDYHVAQHQDYQDMLAKTWATGKFVPEPQPQKIVQSPGYGPF